MLGGSCLCVWLCHTRRAACRSRLVSAQMLTLGRMEPQAWEIQKEVKRGSEVDPVTKARTK